MRLKRKEYTSSGEKRHDFWIGFGLFWGINVLLWALSTFLPAGLTALNLPVDQLGGMAGVLAAALTALPWIVNMVLLIYLGLTRSWMALGLLAGFAVVLLLVVILFVVLLALCFAYGAGNARVY